MLSHARPVKLTLLVSVLINYRWGKITAIFLENNSEKNEGGICNGD
jgi:hypothetical protein